jgi:tryptophan synthase alpha chain
MSRIQSLFKGHKALIAYITAGDPTPERTPELVAALERGGADLVELGVPFSDPIADGPVIQRGADRALKSGTTVKKVLEIARQVREKSQIPLLLFTYLNPVLRYGLEKLALDAKAAGIDGCLLTDLSVEEASPYVSVMRSAGLDTVFLAAPTSTPQRLKLVAKYSTGFVYLVSRTGVTGARASLSEAVGPLVEAMRAVTDLPLAVGFGVSRPEQVAELGRQVEAVVVGSAIVDLIGRNADNASLEIQLESFARELKHGFEMRAAGEAPSP